MRSSRLDIIYPKVFSGENVSGLFIPANMQYEQKHSRIGGLNLGFNTDEKEEVILKNRQFLFKRLGINENKAAIGLQVHKTAVRVVSEGRVYPDTDAFVSNQKGMALTIQVADCAAVLLGDEKNKVIGAAHAGWRGAAAEILPKTIRKMKELGAESYLIKAYISPCISQKEFEIGEEVAAEFPEEFVDYNSFEKPHLNLKGFLKYQMKMQGIKAVNIETDAGCTLSEDRFYSYRRQKNKSGRMMGIIKLNE